MGESLKTGDKVMVPRTGGGRSSGKIVAIVEDCAVVEFPVGETFRGKPSNPKDKYKMATKNVALKDLVLERKKICPIVSEVSTLYVLKRSLFKELGDFEPSVIKTINENFRLKHPITELRIKD